MEKARGNRVIRTLVDVSNRETRRLETCSTAERRRRASIRAFPRRPWERAVAGREICAQMIKYGEMPGNLRHSAAGSAEQVWRDGGTKVPPTCCATSRLETC